MASPRHVPPTIASDSAERRVATGPVRALWIVAGWISLTLGALGIIVPGLPTTPLVLLASACFSRSSPTFQRWLESNRLFGPIVREWRTSRTVPPGVKPRAIAVVILTFGLSAALLADASTWALAALLVVGVGVVFIIARLPSRTPAQASAGEGESLPES